MGRISDAERDKLPNPFVTTISNIVENGRPIGGLGNAEAAWHTDMSYIERSADGEHPVCGGDSGGGRRHPLLQHDRGTGGVAAGVARASAFGTPETRRGPRQRRHSAAGPPSRAQSPLEAPGALHPMVRPHPDNSTEALYLGRRQDAYVEGLPLAESEAFLDEVWRYVALPDAVWTQQLAGRRPAHLGQPQRHAPSRRVCPQRPPPDAPHTGSPGNDPVGAGLSRPKGAPPPAPAICRCHVNGTGQARPLRCSRVNGNSRRNSGLQSTHR